MSTTSAALALLVAGATMAYSLYRNTRAELRRDLHREAMMVGHGASSALQNRDNNAANQILATLAQRPSVRCARLVTVANETLGEYRAPGAACADESAFESVTFAVERAGNPIGRVHLRADFREVHAQLVDFLLDVPLFILLGIAIAGLLSSRLHGDIVAPLVDLLAFVQRVSSAAQDDRLEESGSEECRQLIAGFNEMLNRIDRETNQRERMERELRKAEKLEAVSRIAAAVAHEINTPAQYVGDSVSFLEESFGELMSVSRVGHELSQGEFEEVHRLGPLRIALEAAEIDLLEEDVPGSFELIRQGMDRIARVVRSMHAFTQPQSGYLEIDLNQVVKNVLVVSGSHYRFIADLETSYGNIPNVVGHVPELGQVVLTLVLRAADAVVAQAKTGSHRGSIHVETRRELNGEVLFAIEDNGAPTYAPSSGEGTPQDSLRRQDLEVATMIVQEHGGSITMKSGARGGTRFEVVLPAAKSRPSIRALAA